MDVFVLAKLTKAWNTSRSNYCKVFFLVWKIQPFQNPATILQYKAFPLPATLIVSPFQVHPRLSSLSSACCRQDVCLHFFRHSRCPPLWIISQYLLLQSFHQLLIALQSNDCFWFFSRTCYLLELLIHLRWQVFWRSPTPASYSRVDIAITFLCNLLQALPTITSKSFIICTVWVFFPTTSGCLLSSSYGASLRNINLSSLWPWVRHLRTVARIAAAFSELNTPTSLSWIWCAHFLTTFWPSPRLVPIFQSLSHQKPHAGHISLGAAMQRVLCKSLKLLPMLF